MHFQTIAALAAGAAITLASPSALGASDSAWLTSADELSSTVWNAAMENDESTIADISERLPEDPQDAGLIALTDSFTRLHDSLLARESLREEALLEVSTELDKAIESADSPQGISDALKHAVEYHEIAHASKKGSFLTEPRVTSLIERAEQAAREAEAEHDWLTANEIFFRLNLLLDREGTYRDDVRRLNQRLSMIRLYTPERFWELRNNKRIAEGEKELPPFNPLGEDYKEKLEGISPSSVIQALQISQRKNIDFESIGLSDLLRGGILALRTMVTTADLAEVFPELRDGPAVAEMLAYLDAQLESIERAPQNVGGQALVAFLRELYRINDRTLHIPRNALLHEFGNGAMQQLDDFSAIIWPDEFERFKRMTEGKFMGVGIQIQFDEESQMIKVVTPIEGTPAQRAGIRSGDLLKKVDDKTAVGLSINQAVDLITGPEGTFVTLTMERKVEEKSDLENISAAVDIETEQGDQTDPAPDAEPIDTETTVDIDFRIKRAEIPLDTVKGWKRTGIGEDDQWDYFIDPANRIGYVRLLQFTDDTTRDLHKAIDKMKQDGLEALILDLRFNPGGLLTQAVSVANTFIDRGVIVSTAGTVPGEFKLAQRGAARVRDIPIAVLINEGSASASEIVSGAIKHYAGTQVDAVLIGERTFGKGSVQNVWPLSQDTLMKLTTQYYKLPNDSIIHRRPGDVTWGVDPHLVVDMLPSQVSDALLLRQEADVLPLDENGNIIVTDEPRPDPQQLLDEGTDLQLQTALAILQARTVADTPLQVRLDR